MTKIEYKEAARELESEKLRLKAWCAINPPDHTGVAVAGVVVLILICLIA